MDHVNQASPEPDTATTPPSLSDAAAAAQARFPPSRGRVLTAPTGTVAILNTDIVGSTALGRRLGEEAYAAVRETHYLLMRRVFLQTGGFEVKETGDGFWVAFQHPQDALTCAQLCQDALAKAIPPHLESPLRVRMAVHMAYILPDPTGSDFHGLDLHHAARLLSASNGGQVLVSEAAEVLLRNRMPENGTLADRGLYLLRDAPGPQRLFEYRWPDMPIPDLPRPNAAPVRTPSLPSTFTRFVGREEEIARLVALLSPGNDTRLVTLTGMGGMGKTRLAMEAARQVSDRFAGAVWFVPLVDADDAARLPDRVHAALEATAASEIGPSTGDLLAALDPILGTQPALLILDNLEHLVANGDEIGDFVQNLLERWPLLVVLATSRQRLSLFAEREFPVGPLPTPRPPSRAADTTLPALDQLMHVSSVALFEDRARHARPDFSLTERNVADAATLCRRLEGIPLALELAAAWARVLTPAEMLAQLPDLRRSRDRRLPERHRSLANVLEASYRLLDGDQRRFFRRLAVFRGGWTAAAARVVCDEPDTLLLLADLRDHSLITVEEAGDSTRYTFLETLREFAEAKLHEDPEEATATHQRHRDYFKGFVAEAEPFLKGPEQAVWLKRIAAEHENIRTTLGHLDRADRLRMAGQLHRYWTIRGHLSEGRRWLADAAIEDDSVPEPVRLKALNFAGTLALSAGDLDAAHALFSTVCDRSEAMDFEQEMGGALVNLAIVAGLRGDLENARHGYEASLILWRHLGRTDRLAIVLSNLGAIASLQKDLEAARNFLQESLRLQVTASTDLLLRANTLHNLAEIAFDQQDYPASLRHLKESLQIRLQIEDRSGVPNLIFLLADVKVRQGFLEQAAWLYGGGEAICAMTESVLPAIRRDDIEEQIKILRSVIGDTLFSRSWEEGRAASWKQILACVLETTGP